MNFFIGLKYDKITYLAILILQALDLLENIELNTRFTRHPWETARVFITWSVLKKHVNTKKSQAYNILDVGSGDLFQALSLLEKNENLRITAVDTAYSDPVISKLKENKGAKNIEFLSSVNEIPENKIYSVVLLMDVLEHIEEDKTFLVKLLNKKCFNSETVFFITVPAWQYLFSGHDIALGHYRRYTQQELVKLASESGLEIKSSGYFFFTFWLIRLIQKVFKSSSLMDTSKSELGPWKASAAWAGVIKMYLEIEFWKCQLLSKVGVFFPGLSAFAVCRKKTD